MTTMYYFATVCSSWKNDRWQKSPSDTEHSLRMLLVGSIKGRGIRLPPQCDWLSLSLFHNVVPIDKSLIALKRLYWMGEEDIIS
jgi:hypothetical protein